MKRIPDWKLERLALGELHGPEAERLRAEATAELDELARSDAEILAAHPPERIAAEVERRRRVDAARASARRPSRSPWLVLVPLAAAATVAAVVAVPGTDEGTPLAPEIILTKGDGPTLRVYRQTDGGAEQLKGGASARPGDRLQLATVPMEAAHGVVVSIDGNGAVTLHFPASPAASTALDRGEKPLPSSYELDDAPDFERFFLVAGEAPLPVQAILDAARRLAAAGKARTGALEIDRTWQQDSVLLVKESP